MCRVPVKALPAGTYCPPTWLNEQVTLPAISDAELSMLDSLLNVKPEDVASAAATASTQQQPMAFVAPPPPAFLANVFPAYGAVTHANAPAYAAQASLENRAKRVKKVREKEARFVCRSQKRKKNVLPRARECHAVPRFGAAFAPLFFFEDVIFSVSPSKRSRAESESRCRGPPAGTKKH